MKIFGLILICAVLLPSVAFAATTTIEQYDLKNLTNADDLVEVMGWANEPTNGLFWVSTIILVWLIVYGTLTTKFPSSEALITSLVIVNVYTVLLATLGFVQPETELIPLVALALMVIIRWANPPS